MNDVQVPWLPSLPATWMAVQLRRVAQIRNGADYKEVEVPDGGYPVYGSGGEFRRASDYLFDGESVLFGRKGTIDKPLHVSGPFWTVDTMYYTELDLDKVVPRYLYYYATTMPFALYSTNTALPSMTQAQLAGHLIPLPPHVEQRAVADYLDRETAKIDTLIEEQQRLIEMLRERRGALTSHSVSRGEVTPFHRVLREIRQGWSPNCEPRPADGVTEWGVLKVGCSNSGRFDARQNKKLPDTEQPRPELVVRKGELVMSRSNTKDLVGAAAVVDSAYPRLMLSDLHYGLTPIAETNPYFVAHALGAGWVRHQLSMMSKGTSPSMQKISQRDIRNLSLQIPDLEEQDRIAAYLNEQTSKIDAIIDETERFVELSKERRAALITAAVTGQIDVREAA